MVLWYLQGTATPGTYLYHELRINPSLYDTQLSSFQQQISDLQSAS